MKSKKFTAFIICSMLILYFLCPSICYSGAKKGISLWLNTVFPSLLPFLILSNFILLANLCPYVCQFLYPIFRPLFGVSRAGCFPVLIGMISGFPVGAKNCADLVKNGQITRLEGQYLLSFVNNASPMFITIYLATNCLHRPDLQYALYAIILLSAFLCSILSRFFLKRFVFSGSYCLNPPKKYSFSTALDSSILNGFQTITKIGGYVILFSIVSQFFLQLPDQLHVISYFLLATTEMTTGIYQISESNLNDNIKIILSLASAVSGGLSSLLQTQSVIAESGLSFRQYAIMKLIQTLLVVLLTYIFLIIF